MARGSTWSKARKSDLSSAMAVARSGTPPSSFVAGGVVTSSRRCRILSRSLRYSPPSASGWPRGSPVTGPAGAVRSRSIAVRALTLPATDRIQRRPCSPSTDLNGTRARHRSRYSAESKPRARRMDTAEGRRAKGGEVLRDSSISMIPVPRSTCRRSAAWSVSSITSGSPPKAEDRVEGRSDSLRHRGSPKCLAG